jgi:hypothetical protein
VTVAVSVTVSDSVCAVLLPECWHSGSVQSALTAVLSAVSSVIDNDSLARPAPVRRARCRAPLALAHVIQ